MNEHRPTVLVVDDAELNLELLVELLGDEYKVRVAPDGPAALQAVAKALPDLILLDVMMPGMNGFEVCRRLKEQPATRSIPVIFLTGMNDGTDEERGLALGAVDYITKPFSPALVKARLRSQLELKARRDDLELQVQQRTCELAEAHGRLKAVDAAQQNLLRAVSHELRTPAFGVLGLAEVAIEEMPDPAQRERFRALFLDSSHRLLTTINAALQLAALDAESATVTTVPVELSTLVVAAWPPPEKAANLGPARLLGPPDGVLALGDELLLRESVTTLLQVAGRMAAPGTPPRVELAREPAGAALHLSFECAPLSEELRRTFFHAFSFDRASSRAEELGLAVPLAAHIIRAMGGSVELRNLAAGVEIRVLLRAAEPPDASA